MMEAMTPNTKHDDVPANVMDSLARNLLIAAARFYEDPQNMRRFEAWKAKRDAAQSTAS